MLRTFFLSNFYYLVTVFTAVYSIAFILFLANRLHYSKPSKAFVLFLTGIFAWSVSESLTSALQPFIDKSTLRSFVVLLLPLSIVNINLAFHMLISVFNAGVSPKKAFLHERTVHFFISTALTAVYLISLFDNTFLYHSFHVKEYDYYFKPGFGFTIIFIFVFLAIVLPSFTLIGISRKKDKSETYMIGVGSLVSLLIVFISYYFPAKLGVHDLPRFGVLSVSIFCAFAFYGIKNYHKAFSIGKMLDELKKVKVIVESLKGFIETFNEQTISRNICENAQEITESEFVCLAIFNDEYSEYEIKGVSKLQSAEPGNSVFSKLPLKIGVKYSIEKKTIFSQQINSREPKECGTLEEFFKGQLDSSVAADLNHTGHINQIISYPIILNEQVRGALVLFRNLRTESLEIYSFFAIQCALVIKFSSQIKELEGKREIEEMLHHSQKLQAIGRLAGGIAHDFNNMLAGISGYANIIKRKYSNENQQLSKYIDTILMASDRAADLTNKLLTFARKGSYQMIPVNIHDIIGEVIQLLSHTVDKKIEIEQVLEADPPTITGDPTQIHNILLNLAVNARDAMPNGGKLTFSTSTTIILYKDKRLAELDIHDGEYLRLSVSDTGMGMGKEVLAQIYEPFFTTKNVGKGSGLGLSSVYGAVKDHKGHIEAESEPGKGTTFILYFPLLRSEAPVKAIQPIPKTEFGGKGHILIIDDEPIVGELCKEILSSFGYTVTTYTNSLEGLDFFKNNHRNIDLTIIDMIMPHMGGDECLKEIKKIQSEALVILATGYDFTGNTQKIITKGIEGFIQKPFTEESLLQKVTSVLKEKEIKK